METFRRVGFEKSYGNSSLRKVCIKTTGTAYVDSVTGSYRISFINSFRKITCLGVADYSYIWGDALEELRKANPDIRLINLETSITRSDEYWPGKGINYRMHPMNAPCLTAAHIDLCSLSNNHVLDWGYSGLIETLEVLKNIDVKSAGAGLNLEEAQRPVILETVGAKPRIVDLSTVFPI